MGQVRTFRASMILYITTLAITFLLAVGCSDPTNKVKDTGVYLDRSGVAIRETTIEGCEYLIYDGVKQYGLTHKGNCKNQIHER